MMGYWVKVGHVQFVAGAVIALFVDPVFGITIINTGLILCAIEDTRGK